MENKKFEIWTNKIEELVKGVKLTHHEMIEMQHKLDDLNIPYCCHGGYGYASYNTMDYRDAIFEFNNSTTDIILSLCISVSQPKLYRKINMGMEG